MGHCSAPTHLKHPAEKKHLQLRFGPQLRQPKDSFGLASDLMVSTEPFFSSWGLASPLPPFPPFPPLGRWVCDGPFWGPRPDHATAWISMYKVFTRQTHYKLLLMQELQKHGKNIKIFMVSMPSILPTLPNLFGSRVPKDRKKQQPT